MGEPVQFKFLLNGNDASVVVNVKSFKVVVIEDSSMGTTGSEYGWQDKPFISVFKNWNPLPSPCIPARSCIEYTAFREGSIVYTPPYSAGNPCVASVLTLERRFNDPSKV